MPRRDQFERLRKLLALLARPGGATLPELAHELRTVRRTLYRDLETLERCGVPLQEDADEFPKRWRVSGDFLRRTSLLLGPDELVLLSALDSSVASAGPLSEPLERFLGKVRAALPAELVERGRALQRHVRGGSRQRPSSSSPAGLLATLAEAIESHVRLELDYESLSSGRGLRVVEPLGIALRGRGAYLVARAPLRDEFRKFLLTRIRGVRRTGESFHPPVDFDLAAYFGDAFGVRGGEVHEVVLRFTREAARHVKETIWHESQQLEVQPDGSLVFRMRAAGLVEIKSWVQSYGSSVTVIAPPSLVEAVVEDARRLVARAARSAAAVAVAGGTGRTAGATSNGRRTRDTR